VAIQRHLSAAGPLGDSRGGGGVETSTVTSLEIELFARD
jgi:hypothetical protein